MLSKLNKAIGTMKDQTNIGLAMISKTTTGSLSAHLDLTILKSTTQDKHPVDDHLASDLLHLISTSRANAAASVRAISRRMERTHNWIVAVKCLHLVYLCLRDGGPYFPREAISAINLFDLSGFYEQQSMGVNQSDYISFMGTFTLYLQERLICFLRGKLQNRRPLTGQNPVSDLKPPAILDRIAHWQRLLGRAIETKPVGVAKDNTLVVASFHLVVRESFALYKDVYDGLVLLLDCFFGLQRQTCVGAYQACVRAAKQFRELEDFYNTCRMMSVGRRSEYPEVQLISDELLATLNNFVKSEKSIKKTTRNGIVCLKTAKTMESFRKSRTSVNGDVGSCRLSDCVSVGEESDEDPKANQENSSPSRRTNTVNGATSDLILFDDFSIGEPKDPGETQATGNHMAFEKGSVRESGDDGSNNLLFPDLVMFDEMPEAFPAFSSSDDWELVLAESANGMTMEKNCNFSAVEHGNPFLGDGHGGHNTSFAIWSTPVSSPAMPSTYRDGKFEEKLVSRSGTESCSSANRQVWVRQQCEITASGHSSS